MWSVIIETAHAWTKHNFQLLDLTFDAGFSQTCPSKYGKETSIEEYETDCDLAPKRVMQSMKLVESQC